MFFTAFGLCILRLLKLKTEGQTIYRKSYKIQIKVLAKPGLS